MAVNPQLPLGLALREHARFDSFRAGDNAEIISLLRELSAGRGEPAVCLVAPAGMGKTHLLQAVCHAAGVLQTEVAYLPLRDLQDIGPAALDGLEQLALVCLDDADVVAGDDAWERALFDLYNRCRDAQVALLVALADAPHECGFRLKDLVTRLEWGVTATLKPLDEAQLVEALELRAAARGLELPGETIRYLLKRYPRDLPGMFSLFDRLDAASMVEQRRLTVPFVKEVLAQD